MAAHRHQSQDQTSQDQTSQDQIRTYRRQHAWTGAPLAAPVRHRRPTRTALARAGLASVAGAVLLGATAFGLTVGQSFGDPAGAGREPTSGHALLGERTDSPGSRGQARTAPAGSSAQPAAGPRGQAPSASPTPSPTPAPPAAAAPPPAPATTAAGCDSYSGNRLIACNLLPEFGFGTGQMASLDNLWTRESGWNHLAQNPSSGAYGIPQALPGSKMGTVADDWQTNPATQIRWGLGYIRDRYGNPDAAWAFFQANNWY